MYECLTTLEVQFKPKKEHFMIVFHPSYSYKDNIVEDVGQLYHYTQVTLPGIIWLIQF
jgi:hypothetical protein